MAYQPPIVALKAPHRLRPTRSLFVASMLYLTIAVSYSIGYGQAMVLMATTSAEAARIADGDYAEITGAETVLSPLVQAGIRDALQFKPKNVIFGVFCGLWAHPEHMQLARQNANLVRSNRPLPRPLQELL